MCEISSSATAIYAVVSAVIAAAGTAVKTVSDRQQAKYNIRATIKQAKLAEENAGMERQEAIKEARRERLNSILDINKQKSIFAASNLSVSSSTLLDLSDDLTEKGEMNALNKTDMAERNASNYLKQSESYMEKAKLTSSAAQYSMLSSSINMADTVVTKTFNTINKNSAYKNKLEK